MNLMYNDLTIRNATPGDAAILCQWWNDGAVMEHAGFPNGIGTTEEEIAEKIRNENEHTWRRLLIFHGEKPIGEMCYVDKGENVCEIGIKICEKEYQNKGLGKIVLSMLFEELFGMGFEKIILDTMLENKRAQHVYEELGFRNVCVHENAWKDQMGKLRTVLDYEMKMEEFCSYLK